MTLSKKQVWRNRGTAYTFLLPNILGFLIFIFIPVVASFFISFTDWDGFSQARFIGLDNYIKMFSSKAFKISFWNTIYYTFFSVPFTLACALMIAMALNRQMMGKKIFRTIFYLPHISAGVAVAVVWQLLFHPTMGPINNFLLAIGIDEPPRWLASSQWAMTSVIIVSVWKSMGYFMVLFLAGLQTIPRHLYESADIDGASPVRKFISITLPMLSPTIFFVTIIAIIGSFKVFDMVFTLTEGGPGRSTNVLAFTVYQEAFVKYKFGYASAMAYLLFIMILIVTIIQFQGQKKNVHYV